MGNLNKEPEDYARLLLSKLNLTQAADLNCILAPLRLTVRESIATSFEGALICRMDRSKGVIVVTDSIIDEGRRRFTICHEIGHYILPGHGKVSCRSNEIESQYKGLPRQEVEANRVASELLLPTKLVYPRVVKQKASLALAKELATEFQTSLTAAALKIVDLTEESSVVVWSENGYSKWAKRNENFYKFVPTGRLDQQTIAARLFGDNSIREAEGFVFADAWLNDGSSGNVKFWEDSLYLSNYSAVLTILTQTS